MAARGRHRSCTCVNATSSGCASRCGAGSSTATGSRWTGDAAAARNLRDHPPVGDDTMNTQLKQLLHAQGVLAPAQWRTEAELALVFVERVRHLLEDERIVALLDAGQAWRARGGTQDELRA